MATDPVLPVDRRARKRAAKVDALLDLAAEVVETSGVEGLTMAALAEAADYAPASLYTYFPSRSALVAALQQRALTVLAGVAQDAVATWDHHLAATPAPAAALARLWAFSHLFLTAPEHHPREFLLQQQLLVSRGVEDVADAVAVVPAAMSVLIVPQQLLTDAVAAGALDPGTPAPGPLDEPMPVDLVRTLAWVTALNGALLVDRLSTGIPTTGTELGAEITRSLLAGWGAPHPDLTAARDLAAHTLDGGPSR